jgi:beta-glucosidase/6-phospho-beta-glucosidase/beta-galactosidase
MAGSSNRIISSGTPGFGNCFGIAHMDFKTQKRTPKLSGQWFREAASGAQSCEGRRGADYWDD